ncbi:unnamed protein product [marine sediment metagenome]|uniref:Uncharacterized protein n=1 Tax=marine sediment metagenome TaxID=412755 RepID=X1LL30_9ZZZZ
MKNRCNLISFELTAIDLILVIAVIVLLILYLTKFSVKTLEPKYFRQPRAKDAKQERSALRSQSDYTECPRGFGNIKKLGEDNSVSERCLGCYKIMECYSENE